NLRATAATTVPNMVRGALPLMLLLFNALQHWFSFVQSGWITGIIVLAISVYSASQVEETFSKDLDYLEE
ncbi:MAG TPA: MFS transporter, partial [Ginsengibacter sp.]|nr:MFS transporter [Ginsengibacter sp.]